MRFLRSLLIRALFAAPCFWLAWWFYLGTHGQWGDLPRVFAAFTAGLAGAALLLPPFVELVADPSGSLFYSGEKHDAKLPLYSIPKALRMRGQSAEAMSAYQELLRNYPHDVTIFVEMLNIAVMDFQDRDMADAILKKGLAAVGRRDRKILRQMHESIVSRLADHDGFVSGQKVQYRSKLPKTAPAYRGPQ